MMSTSSPGPTTSYGGGSRHGPAPFEQSRKRKERDGFEGPPRRAQVASRVEPHPAEKKPPPKPSGDNRLLAGYMAHEFLSRGTLLGKPFDPNAKPEREPPPPPAAAPAATNAVPAYSDVARLLMGANGAHIPGVVNPTQLARWLQMQ